MQCWQCGATVRQGAKLCIYCGARLSSDDAPDETPPVERGSDRRANSSGGGMDGSRSRAERDASAGYGSRDAADGGPLSRARGGGDRRPQDAKGERYASWRRDDDAPIARAPSRRGGGPRQSSGGEGRRSQDPLDDPRAPRILRKPPTVPRQQESRQSTYGNERGEHSERGGYEHQGRRYSLGDAGYDPRYDPESGEYDAVEDRRRREQRYPDDDYGRDGYGRGRRTGGQRDERSAGGRVNRRWDESDEGGTPARQYRGGYSDYDDMPSAEYSAEYSAEGPARFRDQPSAEYSSEYSAELDARGGYGGERQRYRGQRYDDEPSAWDAPAPRRRVAPNDPAEDSWNLPAISEAQRPASSRSAAPLRPASIPLSPAARAARGTPKSAGRRRRGRVLIPVVGGLVALIAVAVVIVGVSERTAILSKLPGAPQAHSSTFATYTPGPTPTTVPVYKQFSSNQAMYILNYPGQWTEQSSNQPNTGYDYVDTFTQQSPYSAVIVEQAAAFAGISDANIITAEVNGGKQSGRTFTGTSAAASTVSAGGEQWTRREYDVTDTKTATTLHMAVLSCHHAGRGYAVVLVAAPDAFANDDSTVFKTILGSFRFTS